MKSRMILKIAALLIIDWLTTQVVAYETPTHSEISHEAIEQSALVRAPEFLNDLGLTVNLDQNLFPSEVPVLEKNPTPDRTIYIRHASIRQIIKAGAVLEDRSTNSLHHFYDPINGGRGLTLGENGIVVPAGIASPGWMLETDVPLQFRIFRQDFSYSDAIRYFYKALSSNQSVDRNLNFGLMFRGIGHLIHHIQDMAQPQHVRNDQHCDGAFSFLCRPLDNPSHFERYTDEVRRRIISSSVAYPIPEFPRMEQFWLNASGTGLADFTQSNFISQGTNFEMDSQGILTGNSSYPLPVPYLEAATFPMDLSIVLQQSAVAPDAVTKILQDLQCNVPLVCMVDFIPSYVHDYGMSGAAGLMLNSRASSISLLDDELKNTERPNAVITTYNRLNFHTAYPFLIPRAVAYSTGIINHFFRGRILISHAELDHENNAVITVINSSSPGNTFSMGRFELYYDSVSEGRKRVPEIRISSGEMPLTVGSTLQLTTPVPVDVNTDVEQPYLLVYNALNGKLGEEAGLAASVFDISLAGRVAWLSRNANACPERIYGVAIEFHKQPENNGQVVLRGEQSGLTFDFSTVPGDTGIIRGEAMWRHMIDDYTGKYTYEVTYRYPGSQANPCTTPWLGPWILDEKVKVLPSVH